MNKRVIKKTIITKEEATSIDDQAAVSREILEDERFEFIRDYFQSALDYIEKSILENTIRDVDEHTSVSDRVIRVFKTPKKVQVDELSGQYKFIKKFFNDLEAFINIKEDLDEEVSHNRVIIDGEQK